MGFPPGGLRGEGARSEPWSDFWTRNFYWYFLPWKGVELKPRRDLRTIDVFFGLGSERRRRLSVALTWSRGFATVSEKEKKSHEGCENFEGSGKVYLKFLGNVEEIKKEIVK